MVAKSRDELLTVTAREFKKLLALVDKVDPELALVRDEDGVSIKDVIGHRAHWLELFFGWREDGLAGRELVYPAPGYKGNETKRYNADLRLAQHELGWDDVRTMLDDAHQRLVATLEACSGADLYGHPMSSSHKWTAGRWAEANGPSHYRSAARYIRTRLRDT